jgi:hypothetical protein
MANTHGGHREGAGRKPDAIKLGKSFLHWLTDPDGKRTLLQVVTVTKYDPVTGIIEMTDTDSGNVLHFDSGKRKRRK